MSRELDEKAALAMGWKQCEARGEMRWRRPRNNLARYYSPPEFSVDAARIPEMLAWLRRASYGYAYGGLQMCDLLGDDGYEASIGIGENDSRHDRCFAQGSTLSEALAKLVVAVGEEKEKP